MSTAIRTSGKATAAFLTGVLAAVCGLLALAFRSDFFLVGIVFFWILTLVLWRLSRVEIKRAAGPLRGKNLANWGLVIPSSGFALGFLLLPVT